MSRRLLTAGLSLAVLLGAQSGFGRLAAKPPDLPLVDNDVLTSPPLAAEECDAPAPNLLPIAAAPTVAPAIKIPSLFQLRPSVRRTMASCLLFGANPLLALAPTEGTVDLDEEDYEPAPANDLNIPIRPNTIIRNVPSYGPDAPSACPYIRQQQCAPDRHAVLFADPDFSRDVLQNLEALRQSRELVQTARELGREGRFLEALDYLSLAADLCPGSRFDEEIRATAAEVLVSFYRAAPHGDDAATEQSEPAAEKSNANREVEQRLSLPVTLNFTDAPLRQVFDSFRGWEVVNIYVDKAALDADEISLDRPITIQVENLALKSALKLVLKEANLIYIVQDGAVRITTERSVRAKMQPSLPQVDAGVPAALDQLLYETLKVGLAAAGESEEQEAPVDSPSHGSMEFSFDLDGGFRLFTQFQHGGAVWHVEYNENGLKWWASPDGGADGAHRCTGFNIQDDSQPYDSQP
jgi:hypothetical protein